MTLDGTSNFGKVEVSTTYDASAVTIVLATGEGAKFPDPSVVNYNVVWFNFTDYNDPSDDPNVEIVRVTAKTSDTLTVTRAQEGTSASTKNEAVKTYKMVLGITAKMITDINTDLGTKLANISEDTTPSLGGELDSGAHTIGFTQQTATGDGTTTIDWKLGNKFKFTFGAFNEVFTFTAPTKPCNLLLVLVQDAVGSRTATFPATVKWAGGVAPTLTTGASTIDAIALYYDGTNYLSSSSLNFS